MCTPCKAPPDQQTCEACSPSVAGFRHRKRSMRRSPTNELDARALLQALLRTFGLRTPGGDLMALGLPALLAIAIRPELLGVQTKRRHRLAVGGEAHLGEVADEAAQLKVVGLHGMVPFSPFGDCWLFMACQHQTGLSRQSKLVTFGTPSGSAQCAPSSKVIHFDGWRPSGSVQ